MARELNRCGYSVFASDLNFYDNALHYVTIGLDFLDPNLVDPTSTGVVTNPPFKSGLPVKFARKALAHYEYVALFARLTFLESRERMDLLVDHPLSRIILFAGRINFNEDKFHLKEGQVGGMVAYAWFIWDKRGRRLPLDTRLIHADVNGLWRQWTHEQVSPLDHLYRSE